MAQTLHTQRLMVVSRRDPAGILRKFGLNLPEFRTNTRIPAGIYKPLFAKVGVPMRLIVHLNSECAEEFNHVSQFMMNSDGSLEFTCTYKRFVNATQVSEHFKMGKNTFDSFYLDEKE